MDIFWVRSGLYVKSDSVPICTETAFIFQEILRAKCDQSMAPLPNVFADAAFGWMSISGQYWTQPLWCCPRLRVPKPIAVRFRSNHSFMAWLYFWEH
jgi:hypothetical protein